MSYESITIPVETEKKNLTLVDVKPVSECTAKITELYHKFLSTSMKPDQKIIFDYKTHPVYDGFLDAYRNHRPITISPDIIWILIVQGFSRHVDTNHEELKSLFVNFKGKKDITVKKEKMNICNATTEEWMSFFPEFVQQIKENTGETIIDTLTPNFTTTTDVSLAVGQVSIMHAFKNYFNYNGMSGGCGIPYVTIEGSVEDWEKILIKMNDLRKYKFDEWIDRLTPIINEIIQTIKGNANKEFWMKMIKIKENNGEYNTGYVDGWFTNFFMYNRRNQPVKPPFDEITHLANEFLIVPFDLKVLQYEGQNEDEAVTVHCEMLAGFVGMTQNEKNFSFKPEIGWIIRQQPENFYECNGSIPNRLRDQIPKVLRF